MCLVCRVKKKLRHVVYMFVDRQVRVESNAQVTKEIYCFHLIITSTVCISNGEQSLIKGLFCFVNPIIVRKQKSTYTGRRIENKFDLRKRCTKKTR